MLTEFFYELRARNKSLFWFGWLNVITLILAAFMFLIDDTIIMGINAWIKPMKFAISITIYAWTFAWLLRYLPDPKIRNFIARGIIICMTVENGLIYMQAFRGTTSHFNVHTAFDGMVFSTMGIFILINTFIVFYTVILFFSKKIALETTLLWAWRIGLLLFFLGGISGGIMSARLAHSVGTADGGTGLPLLNWSTVAGDIRSAHFIALHGLQIIPLTTLLFLKVSRQNAGTLVTVFTVIYCGVCLWLHWLAFNGLPFISSR